MQGWSAASTHRAKATLAQQLSPAIGPGEDVYLMLGYIQVSIHASASCATKRCQEALHSTGKHRSRMSEYAPWQSAAQECAARQRGAREQALCFFCGQPATRPAPALARRSQLEVPGGISDATTW